MIGGVCEVPQQAVGRKSGSRLLQSKGRIPVGRLRWGFAVGAVVALVVFGSVTNVGRGRYGWGSFWSQFGVQDRARYLKDIWTMIVNYDDLYGHLPPRVVYNEAGQACHSWRSLAIQFGPSYLGRTSLDTKISWQDPSNREWAESPESWFCWQSSVDSLNTRVVAVSGTGTPLDANPSLRLADLPHDTILLLTVAHSGVHWMEPGDIDIEDIERALKDNNDGLGILVLFADGEVWQFAKSVPPSELKRFSTIAGARLHDRDKSLAAFRVRRF
jgi:hypothetical protein